MGSIMESKTGFFPFQKVKCKCHHVTCHRAESRYTDLLMLTLAVKEGGCSNPCPKSAPPKKQAPTCSREGCVGLNAGLYQYIEERISCITGFRNTNSPPCSDLLSRLDFIYFIFWKSKETKEKTPVAERSKAKVCRLSLAGIAGLNSAGAQISVLCVVRQKRSLRRADPSSRGALQTVLCNCA